MGNLIVGGIILLIIGGAVAKIIKEKKNGAKCIGCPSRGCAACKSECAENKHDK